MHYVYMLANWNHNVIYTGVTSHLERRTYEHKSKLADGFTKKKQIPNGRTCLRGGRHKTLAMLRMTVCRRMNCFRPVLTRWWRML